jgi:hypothetical protein
MTTQTTPRYYGKYKGEVTNNVDPLGLGKVQIKCPSVLGATELPWAYPCTPYAGNGVGLFLVPPVGAKVWVEFEEGNKDYPILAGCYWGTKSEVPVEPALASTKMLKTDGLTLTINDLPGAGGVTLEVHAPAVAVPVKIALTSSGIEISTGNASVKLDPVSVSINDGALRVI